MPHLNTILDLYGFNEPQQEGLLEALKISNCTIIIDESSSTIEALEVFNNALQESYIRPHGSERQQMSDKFEKSRAELLPLLNPFIEKISSGADVAHKLLLGGSESSVKKRLDILVNLTNNHHYTKIVYPLGGERDLWAIEEKSAAKLIAKELKKIDPLVTTRKVEAKFTEIFTKVNKIKSNHAAYIDSELVAETNQARLTSIKYFTELGIKWPTETDMMASLIAEYQTKLASIEFTPVIHSEKKVNEIGQLVRPDTFDTYNKMWEIYGDTILAQTHNDTKLTMSIITTQPYGHYQQQQAIKAFNNKPIIVELIAGEDPRNINLSIIFDSLARTIYAGKDVVLAKLKLMEYGSCLSTKP